MIYFIPNRLRDEKNDWLKCRQIEKNSTYINYLLFPDPVHWNWTAIAFSARFHGE